MCILTSIAPTLSLHTLVHTIQYHTTIHTYVHTHQYCTNRLSLHTSCIRVYAPTPHILVSLHTLHTYCVLTHILHILFTQLYPYAAPKGKGYYKEQIACAVVCSTVALNWLTNAVTPLHSGYHGTVPSL